MRLLPTEPGHKKDKFACYVQPIHQLTITAVDERGCGGSNPAIKEVVWSLFFSINVLNFLSYTTKLNIHELSA